MNDSKHQCINHLDWLTKLFGLDEMIRDEPSHFRFRVALDPIYGIESMINKNVLIYCNLSSFTFMGSESS